MTTASTVNNTRNPSTSQAPNNNSSYQAVVKEEDTDDEGEDEDDVNDVDENVYQPRPQLPKPIVHMRSVTDLTSMHARVLMRRARLITFKRDSKMAPSISNLNTSGKLCGTVNLSLSSILYQGTDVKKLTE